MQRQRHCYYRKRKRKKKKKKKAEEKEQPLKPNDPLHTVSKAKMKSALKQVRQSKKESTHGAEEDQR